MPITSQTPTSKRFLPPSGSSVFVPRQSQAHNSAVTPNFVRPSQPSSSSPFTRTPFSQQLRAADKIEDIESNAEDVERSLGYLQKTTQKSIHFGLQEWDNIEDNELPERFSAVETDDILAEQNHFADYVNALAHHSEDSPIPKRRKILPPTITSSVYEGDDDVERFPHTGLDEAHALEQERYQPDDEDLDAEDFNLDIQKSLHTPRTKLPFQCSNIQPDPPPFQSTRPSFLSSLTGVAGTNHLILETTLPDAFSPSRKKGKTDYVYGGAADTVRKWVLDLASEASREVQPSQTDQHFYVEEVVKDRNRRFAIVKSRGGEYWALINPHRLSGLRSSGVSGIDALHRNCMIVLKGSEASRWRFPSVSHSAALAVESSGTCCEYRVAVLWEIAE